jgi:hypothetical protein
LPFSCTAVHCVKHTYNRAAKITKLDQDRLFTTYLLTWLKGWEDLNDLLLQTHHWCRTTFELKCQRIRVLDDAHSWSKKKNLTSWV